MDVSANTKSQADQGASEHHKTSVQKLQWQAGLLALDSATSRAIYYPPLTARAKDEAPGIISSYPIDLGECRKPNGLYKFLNANSPLAKGT